MQLLGSSIFVTSLSVVLRFTCTLVSLLCGSFMIPTVRPFCKMGTSIKRRRKLWISGEFTENKRCDIMFMLGGMCRGEGQEIRKENGGSKSASSVFYSKFPIIRQPEDHHALPGVISGEEIPAFDLVVEFQLLHGHQVGQVFVGGVVEKQEDLPGVFVVGA